jgi:hypothetical protein
MNGGMWGGTKDAFHDISSSYISSIAASSSSLATSFDKYRQNTSISAFEALVLAWENKNEYMADLHFLHDLIWPLIKTKQFAHDSYCCDRFPNAHPFPTKRYMDYQHVGQVFDEQDRPRLTDIDGFIRGVPIPSSCRKRSDWIYG